MDKFFIKFLYRASIVVYRKGEVISLWSAVVVILNVFVEFFWNNKEKENERVQSKNLILKKKSLFFKGKLTFTIFGGDKRVSLTNKGHVCCLGEVTFLVQQGQ